MKYNTIVKFIILVLCHVNSTLSLVSVTSIDNEIPRISLEDFFEEDTQLSTSPQVYGTCLGVRENGSSCSLNLEARRPTNSSNDLLTCNFDLPSPKDWTLKCDNMYNRAATITKDKALLVQSQSCNHNWYVLHFSTCTVVHLTSIRACDWAFILQVPLEDTVNIINPKATRLFDVMLDGSNRVMLRSLSERMDRMSKLARVPITLRASKAYLFSTTKGRLFVDITTDDNESFSGAMNISTFDNNGMNHTLKEYQTHSVWGIFMSVTHELLTICFPINTGHLTCIQFNSDGDVNFEIQVNLGWVYVYEIHNLPGGEFIIIFEDCSGTSCEENTVKKFDRTGNIVGTLKTTVFNCIHSTYIQVFERENGEQCLSQLCPRGNNYNLEMICFDNEDYIRENSTTNTNP